MRHPPARLLPALLLLVIASPANGEGTPALPRALQELDLKEAPQPVRERPGWRKPVRIVVRPDSPARLAAYQAAAPGVEIVTARDAKDALAMVANADALLGFCEPELIAAAKELRWIQVYSAGVQGCVEVPALKERKILLTNMQRTSGPEIAEHVLAMLLAFTRGLNVWLPEQRQGAWNRGAFPIARLRELKGQTLLVVGLGGIGTALAERAEGLGMRVIATRGGMAPKPSFVDYVGRPEELLKLAGAADVVVNCTPLLPGTTGLFDAKFFAAMKGGGSFFNVGRGKSVVQDDLVAALKSGRLAGAGLDVTDPEPLPATDPLWQLPNVIITPHVAAISDQVFARVGELATENLRRYAAGERMLSVVDVDRGY